MKQINSYNRAKKGYFEWMFFFTFEIKIEK